MQHSETLFIQMKDTLINRMRTETSSKHYTYENLAADMNSNGCRTARGKHITSANLRKLVSDCNRLRADDDFRQNHYPDILEETKPRTMWDCLSTDNWNEQDKPSKSDEKLERFSYAIIRKYL